MKRIILALFLATPAMAQDHTQPITLSAEEYQQIVSALAQRDPVVAALMKRQQEAQATASAKLAPAETPPVPAAPRSPPGSAPVSEPK